jgi:hypothetical protein
MNLGALKWRPPADTDAAGLDWDAVFADQLPRVLNYFRFRLGRGADLADMEELTARTFEKVWRARSRYRRDLAGFSTWLFSIAHNVGARVDFPAALISNERCPTSALSPRRETAAPPAAEAVQAAQLQR